MINFKKYEKAYILKKQLQPLIINMQQIKSIAQNIYFHVT